MRWFILSETDLNWCTMYHRYCLLPQKPQTTDPNYNPFELRIYHLTRQIAKLKYSRAISLSKWILNASQSGILRINSPSAHNPFSTHKVWSRNGGVGNRRLICCDADTNYRATRDLGYQDIPILMACRNFDTFPPSDRNLERTRVN